MCKNEIEDNNEELYNPFTHTVSQESIFGLWSSQRPPAIVRIEVTNSLIGTGFRNLTLPELQQKVHLCKNLKRVILIKKKLEKLRNTRFFLFSLIIWNFRKNVNFKSTFLFLQTILLKDAKHCVYTLPIPRSQNFKHGGVAKSSRKTTLEK